MEVDNNVFAPVRLTKMFHIVGFRTASLNIIFVKAATWNSIIIPEYGKLLTTFYSLPKYLFGIGIITNVSDGIMEIVFILIKTVAPDTIVGIIAACQEE